MQHEDVSSRLRGAVECLVGVLGVLRRGGADADGNGARTARLWFQRIGPIVRPRRSVSYESGAAGLQYRCLSATAVATVAASADLVRGWLL